MTKGELFESLLDEVEKTDEEFYISKDISNGIVVAEVPLNWWNSQYVIEPCEDTISRQAALNIYDDYNVAVENGELEAYRKHRKRILKLPSVQPKPIECEDAISRKEALEALEQEEPLVWCDGADEIAAHSQWSSDVDTIKNMPPVQPKYNANEWCHDCSEYDHEKYCCPRFNGVIRKAVDKIAKMESEGTDADSH